MTNVLEQNEVTTAPRRNLITAKTLSYIVLALAIAVSGYLSYEKLTPGAAVCIAGGAFDCGTVLNSVYSEFLGIPIAALGLATNLVVLSILLLENRIGFLREFATPLVFGILLFAFIYSVYLVYLQAFVIGAYCPWCLSHEALIAVLFGIWTVKGWQYLSVNESETSP